MRTIVALFASHSLAAFSTTVSNTGCKFFGEVAMTRESHSLRSAASASSHSPTEAFGNATQFLFKSAQLVRARTLFLFCGAEGAIGVFKSSTSDSHHELARSFKSFIAWQTTVKSIGPPKSEIGFQIIGGGQSQTAALPRWALSVVRRLLSIWACAMRPRKSPIGGRSRNLAMTLLNCRGNL